MLTSFWEKYQRAIEFCQQSLIIARKIGDRYTEGSSLGNLGLAYLYQGEYSQAIEFCQQSLVIAREIGDRYTEGKSLANLGNAYLYQGEYQRAIKFCQQSLVIARDIGDSNTEAIAWFYLGSSLKELNRKSDALSAFRNSRELFQAMGLDDKVQSCDNAIEYLSQRGLGKLWYWIKKLLRLVIRQFSKIF